MHTHTQIFIKMQKYTEELNEAEWDDTSSKCYESVKMEISER